MSKHPRIAAGLESAVIILLTVLAAVVLILLCKANPAEAGSLFLQGIFRNTSSMMEVFVKACPLILTGLGCAVAFRAGFFNIGAEGQFYVGAMTGTIVSLSLPFEGPVNVILVFFAGFLSGGL